MEVSSETSDCEKKLLPIMNSAIPVAAELRPIRPILLSQTLFTVVHTVVDDAKNIFVSLKKKILYSIVNIWPM